MPAWLCSCEPACCAGWELAAPDLQLVHAACSAWCALSWVLQVSVMLAEAMGRCGQVHEYNGDANVTGYPHIGFPVHGVPFSNASYQGLLFSPNTHPGKNVSLMSFDLIWDRVVAAQGTGAPSCDGLGMGHSPACGSFRACSKSSPPLPTTTIPSWTWPAQPGCGGSWPRCAVTAWHGSARGCRVWTGQRTNVKGVVSDQWGLAPASLAACGDQQAEATRCSYPDSIAGTFNQSLTYQCPTLLSLPHFLQVLQHAVHLRRRTPGTQLHAGRHEGEYGM